MLVFQDPARPNVVLDAVVSLASPATTRFRALVAYTTLSGCEQLVSALEGAVGIAWADMPKTIITSFDYGITEPEALEYLEAAGFEIRIANLGEGGRLVIIPAASAFHPKAYLFDSEERVSGLVGSPNLTRRALTVNVEVAYLADLGEAAVIDEQWWEAAVDGSAPLTEQLLAEYRERRPDALRRQRPPREPVPPPAPPAPGVLKMFSEAVADGDVDPQEFAAFWVEAGSMSSGGSHNQLELPRRASAFFGYAFADYDDEHHTLGHPELLVRGERFTDRPLTWHGNNRMERINLPTFHQSGLRYPDTAILFRRLEDGFSLEVRPWDSPEALAWRGESEAAGHVYRVGNVSTRVCGLL
jgi:HKD family nuclease